MKSSSSREILPLPNPPARISGPIVLESEEEEIFVKYPTALRLEFFNFRAVQAANVNALIWLLGLHNRKLMARVTNGFIDVCEDGGVDPSVAFDQLEGDTVSVDCIRNLNWLND